MPDEATTALSPASSSPARRRVRGFLAAVEKSYDLSPRAATSKDALGRDGDGTVPSQPTRAAHARVLSHQRSPERQTLRRRHGHYRASRRNARRARPARGQGAPRPPRLHGSFASLAARDAPRSRARSSRARLTLRRPRALAVAQRGDREVARAARDLQAVQLHGAGREERDVAPRDPRVQGLAPPQRDVEAEGDARRLREDARGTPDQQDRRQALIPGRDDPVQRCDDELATRRRLSRRRGEFLSFSANPNVERPT